MQRPVQSTRTQEPLTGNFIHNRYIDVYRQIVAKNPKTTLFCRFWTELDGDRIEAYNLIAAQINAHFFAPLQGRIQELEQENAVFQARIGELEQENIGLEVEAMEELLTDDEEPMMPCSAGVAMAAAMTEQATRIEVLEALVKEMEQTLVYCWDNEFPVDEVEALQRRAQELLKGEQ